MGLLIRKTFLILLCVCLFGLKCGFAATHSPATCGYADVSAAVTEASEGDTIAIPAAPVDPGYCDWGTNRISTTKSLKWIGAGTSQTIIKGKGVNYSGMMAVTARSTFEMSGIQWISSLTTSINGNSVMTINTAESGWRIHDCIFTYDQQGTTNGFGILAITGQVYYGLVDNNTFNLVQVAFIATNVAHAQTAWQADAQWGTENANFVENNKIYGGYAGGQYPELVQSNNGARVVVRHNDFYDAAIQSHSACQSTIRGTRSYEVYNNYFHNTHNLFNFYVQMRAGSVVVTKNKVAGVWWSTAPGRVHLDNRRSQFDAFCTGWGGRCDGNSDYDGNAENPAHGGTVDGWACIDQIGRGKQTGIMGSGGTQASDPSYVWGNVTGQVCLSGTAKYGECDTAGGIAACTAGGGTCSSTTLLPNTVYLDTNNNSSYHIVSERDFYAGTEKSGWTAYTCPHPLAGEGTCDTDVAGTAGYSIGLDPDITPPVISNQAPTGQQACTGDDEEVEIGVTTDENATCKYDTSDVAYASMANTFSSTGGTTHTQTVTSDCSSSPLYYVRCMDEAENVNTVSAQISYQMASDEDTTPPTLSARALGTDGRTITLTATESIVYGSGGSAGWTVATDAENEISVVYVSGAGTASIVLQTDRIVLSTETITLSYTQPSDGWEDQAGNDLATIEDAAITNGSDHSGASDGTQLWHDDVYTVGGVTADLGSEGAGERGIQFKSSRAGKLTHVKFYKQANDTGTHVVNVWAINGTNLATKTVTGETESGVQTVELDSPVEILPDTYYVVSYFCPTGNLFRTVGYFDAEFTSSTFTVPANGGRVALSSSTRFPTNSQRNNLWLDFEFVPGFEVTTSITGAGGTITGDRAALEDETTTATITLRSGWKASVTGCGGSSSQTGNVVTYTTGAITEDCEITAVASEKQILLVQ